MISLQDRIMGHPISDPAYMAHLRTADVFNEVHAARNAFFREQERAVRARIAEEMLALDTKRQSLRQS